MVFNFIIVIVIAALTGILIPLINKNFLKIYPNPLYVVIIEFIRSKKIYIKKPRNKTIINKYIIEILFFTILNILLFSLFYIKSAQYNNIYFFIYLCIFIWLNLLLAAIDYKYNIIPDFINFILIILGFGFALFFKNLTQILPLESFAGAFIGYFIPVLVLMFFYSIKRNKESVGGGDIKLLAASGAWVGIENFNLYVIILIISFSIYCIFKKNRYGALGPSAAIANILSIYLII